MGLFDDIVCEYPLPGTPPVFVKPGHAFQTKDLECYMASYRITADGRLTTGAGTPVDHTGAVNFYAGNGTAFAFGFSFTDGGEDCEYVEYQALFHAGALVSLVEREREREPALPRRVLDEAEAAGASPYEPPPVPERFAGLELFHLGGGQELGEGCPVRVLGETEHEVCFVRSDRPPVMNDLQTAHKDLAWGRTLFPSREEAGRERAGALDATERIKAALRAKMEEKKRS